MASVELERVTFTYPDADAPAIADLSLSVREGEFVVLAGPPGSGKSTLLRLLKREVSPGGRLQGSIRIGGRRLEELPPREAAAEVGLVLQHPENQLVVDVVEHELAFGMENLGLDRPAMRRRMAEMAGFFGLEPLLARRTDELSGGQKQMVNLASVLMLQPRLLLLDEPLAQLDPLAARELLDIVVRLNEEWGITVILSEHRLDELFQPADRIVRLEQGRLAFVGTPRDYAREAWRSGDAAWLATLPSVTRWAMERQDESGAYAAPPLSVKEARGWLAAWPDGWTAPTVVVAETAPSAAAPAILQADEIFYGYDKRFPAVLRGLDWTIHAGDRIALFGGNGSGKSTLLQLLGGLREPQRGEVRLGGVRMRRIAGPERFARIGYLAQNPLLHFTQESLLQELRQAARQHGHGDPETAAREIADRLGLAALLRRHPHDLSGGERQLGALAVTLLGHPELLLLDEPTKGMDPAAKDRLLRHLEEAHRAGVTLVVATHDLEFAAAYATRCSLLFQGAIVADGEPEAFFRGNLFYATPLHRMLYGGIAVRRGEAVSR